ncbi:MAG TPA: hypothetical protein VIP70_08750 [Nitrososphaeraceae archaeon]
MEEEEHSFLEEICCIALSVDTKVEFVGIVDSNGKLLVGKCRQSVNDCCRIIKSNLFYSALLIPSLNICKKKSVTAIEDDDDSYDNKQVHIKLVEFDNIKLAIVPLTDEKDRHLCVYLQPTASYKEVIPKTSEYV